MERHITHLSCETQPGEICVLTGGFQRWLGLDRESNQRERRGARWTKALDPTISQTERDCHFAQGEYQPEGVLVIIIH